MKQRNFRAFTVNYPGRVRVLLSEVAVSLAYKPEEGGKQPPFLKYITVWDTGSTSSVISEKIVAELGLKPTGKTKVSGVNREEVRDTYIINIRLPNRVELVAVRAVGCKEIKGEAEMLVGMDVIGSGDFAVTNVEGKTTLSFRFPSVKKIDFVETARKIKEMKPPGHKELKRKKKLARQRRRKERRKKKKK